MSRQPAPAHGAARCATHGPAGRAEPRAPCPQKPVYVAGSHRVIELHFLSPRDFPEELPSPRREAGVVGGSHSAAWPVSIPAAGRARHGRWEAQKVLVRLPRDAVVDSRGSGRAPHPDGRVAVALLHSVSAGTARSLLQLLRDEASRCQALPQRHTRHLHKHPFGRGRAACAAGFPTRGLPLRRVGTAGGFSRRRVMDKACGEGCSWRWTRVVCRSALQSSRLGLITKATGARRSSELSSSQQPSAPARGEMAPSVSRAGTGRITWLSLAPVRHLNNRPRNFKGSNRPELASTLVLVLAPGDQGCPVSQR